MGDMESSVASLHVTYWVYIKLFSVMQCASTKSFHNSRARLPLWYQTKLGAADPGTYSAIMAVQLIASVKQADLSVFVT